MIVDAGKNKERILWSDNPVAFAVEMQIMN
jgi:hypothetical protein